MANHIPTKNFVGRYRVPGSSVARVLEQWGGWGQSRDRLFGEEHRQDTISEGRPGQFHNFTSINRWSWSGQGFASLLDVPRLCDQDVPNPRRQGCACAAYPQFEGFEVRRTVERSKAKVA
jgi:hypothetical protein